MCFSAFVVFTSESHVLDKPLLNNNHYQFNIGLRLYRLSNCPTVTEETIRITAGTTVRAANHYFLIIIKYNNVV